MAGIFSEPSASSAIAFPRCSKQAAGGQIQRCIFARKNLQSPPQMRFRNRLLALVLLGLFVAFGFLYFRIWVNPKPFAVIVFLGDGLTLRDLTAARLFDGGADHRLAMESFPHVAILSNHANDFAVPDDASAATAIATGAKVNHRSVAIDPNGRQLQSLLDLARDRGRSIGVVTTGNLTD